jgi:hypothetical protein
VNVHEEPGSINW